MSKTVSEIDAGFTRNFVCLYGEEEGLSMSTNYAIGDPFEDEEEEEVDLPDDEDTDDFEYPDEDDEDDEDEDDDWDDFED